MSQLLTEMLNDVRIEYVRSMTDEGAQTPYLTAYRICNQKLWLDAAQLAAIVHEDPKLLSARASDLIDDDAERENPSVGVIISSNIIAAALEGLLAVAVNHQWLETDDEGRVLVSTEELDSVPANSSMDYSVMAEFAPAKGQSRLSVLFEAAEKNYLQQLADGPHDAYQLALAVASDYAIFAPEDLAPLISENPLLLGLRADDMKDNELFEGDPPAGIIVSAHLTEMLVQQLIEHAVEQGAIALDADGLPIFHPVEGEDKPTVH